jgi:hypothetical protein
LSALFILLGELVAEQREAAMSASYRPAHRKGRVGRRSPSVRK